MSFIPKFRIYNSAGDTIIYTFPYVQYTNAPRSVKSVVEIKSQRGKGSIIIDGGEDSHQIIIRFLIDGEDYEEVTEKIVALESAIALNTPYLLRIEKTDSTYFEWNVKRVDAINYAESLRNGQGIQKVSITLLANSW